MKRSHDCRYLTTLARLVLQLGETKRITRGPKELESVATHSVMLALAAFYVTESFSQFEDLDLSRVLLFALVHDLPEALCGDTSTLRPLSISQGLEKQSREARAVSEIINTLPWLGELIEEYEQAQNSEHAYYSKEAALVHYLDKMMPKIVHYLNEADVLRQQGVEPQELEQLHKIQNEKLRAQHPEMYILYELFEAVAEQLQQDFSEKFNEASETP